MLILPSRRQVLTGLGAAAGVVGATGVYGFGVEPLHRLVVTRYAPALPGWADGPALRIAVLADFHVCEPFMPFDRVAEIVDATNALRPDLILMLGDYPAGEVAWSRLPLADFARLAEGLRAPLGTYSILGNHDWWDDHHTQATLGGTPQVRRLLEARGIPVLENDVLRLARDGKPFWLAGLGDQEPFKGRLEGVDDLPGTLAKVTDDAPVILMAHEPHIFPEVPSRVALTLSGHTHGGQIRLFGRSPAIRRIAGHDLSYGHCTIGDRHLIVSGGFGVSRIPVRFGVPPEIVLVELGRSAPEATSA
ncbi:metallophosphoesterase [Methylobacterium sp. J-076]|uniref:metallophosphoesterase n=1 Tax=Methylobacterium sp. J-076 TaxID=2836655 RepID=UPI001FB8ED61|nr:metallophosphoesterase [Methylobacterium sp. J-076]MCJ2013000.1 metallophosphoesterase [Methylobacterium sp. J-076]